MCFVLFPADYVASFQLDGVAGQAAVRGLGIAFLMWNVTYPPFIWNPGRSKVLGVVILVQQVVGLLGELYIYTSLPETGFEIAASSIMRFVAFDGIGLLLMLISFSLLCVLDKRDVTKVSEKEGRLGNG